MWNIIKMILIKLSALNKPLQLFEYGLCLYFMTWSHYVVNLYNLETVSIAPLMS